jgi:hypothetical protein
MIISNSQLSQLAEPLDAQFIDKLAQMLSGPQEPKQHQPLDQLRGDVKRMVDKALQYEMNTEQGAAYFVVTAFLLGEDFDQKFPAAGPVLNSKSLSSGEKASWLADWTTLMFRTLNEGRE